MNIRPIIKKNARESLKHHWGRTIGILLFLFAVNAVFLLLEQLFYYLLSMNGTVEPALVVDLFRGQLRVTWSMALVTLTFALVSFVLTTPLMFGMTKWYFHQVGGERPSLLTLFTYFYSIRDLARSLALRVMLGVRVLLWGALFGLPSAVLAFGIEAAAGYGGSFALLAVLGLILLEAVVTVIMALLWFCWVQRYFLAEYLFVSRADMGLHAMIRESVRIMKGNRWDAAKLYLSYLPWYLLGLLVVPLLFTAPYLFAGTAINARVLLERDARNQTEQI